MFLFRRNKKGRERSNQQENSQKVKAEKKSTKITLQPPPKPDMSHYVGLVDNAHGPSWTYDVSTSTWSIERTINDRCSDSSTKASAGDLTPPRKNRDRQRKGDPSINNLHSYEPSMETIPENHAINLRSRDSKNKTMRDNRTAIETVSDEELTEIQRSTSKSASGTSEQILESSHIDICAKDKLLALNQKFPQEVPTQYRPKFSPNGRGRKASLVKVSTRPEIERSLRGRIFKLAGDDTDFNGSERESNVNIPANESKTQQPLRNHQQVSSPVRTRGAIPTFNPSPPPPSQPLPAIPKREAELKEVNNTFHINQPVHSTTTPISTLTEVKPTRTILGYPIDNIDVTFSNQNSELLSPGWGKESSACHSNEAVPQVGLPDTEQIITLQQARDIMAAARNHRLHIRQNAREYIPVTYPTPPGSSHSESLSSQFSVSSESLAPSTEERIDSDGIRTMDKGTSTNVHMIPIPQPRSRYYWGPNGSRLCVGDSLSDMSSIEHHSQASTSNEFTTTDNKPQERPLRKRLWDRVRFKLKKSK